MVDELLKELNAIDEHPKLEAKACSSGDLGSSFYETVCAFSNEPSMAGGRLILGVQRDESDFFGGYEVVGVKNPDKLQLDIASGCAERFNVPLRPRITGEEIQGKVVLVVEVDERPNSDKPVYFKKQGLPRGAWRRIGSSDQRCSEEDMVVFYGDRRGESHDAVIIHSAELSDLDSDAIENYRSLRAKINLHAEELFWTDKELLQALSAIKKENDEWKPTLAGLLLFGSKIALRRELPMVRVDYIRVAGNEWVSDPDQRFYKTTDMRGPILPLVDRVLAAVMDDLPKGFELREGDVQSKTKMLPARVLREAIVNALMHRSYREHSPTQVIRYNNRIEIKNAGFSLKNEDSLGEAGSQLRNPKLAAVFHETNTAETKGSGIRTMRRLMQDNGFSAPTFESNRADNFFTSRLLLHHFLSEGDMRWLGTIPHDLNDQQKLALIFLREQGAINNQSERQLTGSDMLTASADLRKLRDLGLISRKGKGSATYYVKGPKFPKTLEESAIAEAEEASGHGTLAAGHGTLAAEHGTLAAEHGSLRSELPTELLEKVEELTLRPGNKVRPVLKLLCQWRALTATQIAEILGRNDSKSIKRDHLKPMIDAEELVYTYPDMEKHPHQAYQTR
ncbi:MAG: ATP-binding protein [Pontiella sp.]